MAFYRAGGQSSSGNAVAADVLLNKTFSNDDDTDVVGTMPNNGKVTPSGLNCGGSYTIPAGYHNGQGVVTANSLASQTGVDSGKTAVGAAQMLTGYQGWVNGTKITGSMANQGTKNYTINPGGSQTIPAGYHSGSGKVTANPNQNSGTKTITSSDANWLTGNVDMGANNTYRYVNAVNVYNKGKTDAFSSGTVLWTNPSPNSDQAGMNITLSKGISNFTYIKFIPVSGMNNATIIVPTSALTSTAAKIPFGYCSYEGGSYFYYGRYIQKSSDTVIYITGQFTLGINYGGYYNNAWCKLYQVVGLA